MTYRVIYTGNLDYIRLVSGIVEHLEEHYPDGIPEHNSPRTALLTTVILRDGEHVDFHIYTNTRGINIYCGGRNEKELDETS